MFFNCRTTAALARRHARLAAIPDAAASAAVAMSLISPYYYLVDWLSIVVFNATMCVFMCRLI